ncbi:MAG: hypothetical protein C4519_07145 [Desulfobacteraceae bacterium]|nr:MAG: hypothetical protein C4519_07145 [Desulfobacteraceae bacterium]
MLSDDDFRLLLDHLDRPWSGFRKIRKGVKKRVRRHMTALGCTGVQDYLHRIDQDFEARAECERRLAVIISRFFRDRPLWDHLQARLLPELMNRFHEGLSAWSAGCARGEEPYSLAIIREETAAAVSPASAVRILATDADPSCLQHAREGLYPPSSLKEVPEALKGRWFKKECGARQMRIDPRLQTSIRFLAHDLLDAPPQGFFHLVLLRNNLLTYYQGLRLQTAFESIVGRIVPGGLLIVGSHERPPAGPFHLIRDPECPWVYHLA